MGSLVVGFSSRFRWQRLATNARARCLQAALVITPFVLGLESHSHHIKNIGTLELIGSVDLGFLWTDDHWHVSEKAQSLTTSVLQIYNHSRTKWSELLGGMVQDQAVLVWMDTNVKLLLPDSWNWCLLLCKHCLSFS